MLCPCCVGTNSLYGIHNQQNLVVPICKQYGQNNTETMGCFISVPGEFLHSLWHSSPPCLHPLALATKRAGSHPHRARWPKRSSIQGWTLTQNVSIRRVDVSPLTIFAANMNLPTDLLWRLPETAFVFSLPQDSHSSIITLAIASALDQEINAPVFKILPLSQNSTPDTSSSWANPINPAINPWMPKQSRELIDSATVRFLWFPKSWSRHCSWQNKVVVIEVEESSRLRSSLHKMKTRYQEQRDLLGVSCHLVLSFLC